MTNVSMLILGKLIEEHSADSYSLGSVAIAVFGVECPLFTESNFIHLLHESIIIMAALALQPQAYGPSVQLYTGERRERSILPLSLALSTPHASVDSIVEEASRLSTLRRASSSLLDSHGAIYFQGLGLKDADEFFQICPCLWLGTSRGRGHWESRQADHPRRRMSPRPTRAPTPSL